MRFPPGSKITSEALKKYAHAQLIARGTMDFITAFIREGVSAVDIKDAAETFMKARGTGSFWYYGIGAFVLVGEQTRTSISGREYCASNLKIKAEDLVTVDLSPEVDGFWGDLARTFAVQDGGVVEASLSEVQEIADGIKTNIAFHDAMKRVIGPDTTFEEVYFKLNSIIEEAGYENLDFNRNLGHSIVKHIDDRIYIESGNKTKLKDAELFTFEPHIKKIGGKYGFKHENIYYFDQGKLQTL